VTDAFTLDPVLRRNIAELMDEGRTIWDRFDIEVRQHDFHPFVPADYELVLQMLLSERQPGLRFLEWGSATGIITIMADLLGFEAYGIEIDDGLVRTARELSARFDSKARFAAGSFLPTGYEWQTPGGDGRLGTIERGHSGYLEFGRPLEDFDIVYGYPWSGEEPLMIDVMRRYGSRSARLVVNSGTGGFRVYRGGKLLP
jgi:hypothetical protein